MPALVEADDLGHYVVKLRGAGQGPKALTAELVAGELGRALGLRVPDIALVEVEHALAASEPDPELCLPLEASVGTNLGLDFLPGSITFDPIVGPVPDAQTASRIVLFDAFVANVDRTPRNANLLSWHRDVWLIDHGAALYFHHGWTPATVLDESRDPFREVKDHVLLLHATALEQAATHLSGVLTEALIDGIVQQIPDDWLTDDQSFEGAAAQRRAYRAWLVDRLSALPALVEEAERARALRV